MNDVGGEVEKVDERSGCKVDSVGADDEVDNGDGSGW